MNSLIYSWGFPHTALLVAMTTIGGVSGVNKGVSTANNSQVSQQHGTQGDLLHQHTGYIKAPKSQGVTGVVSSLYVGENFCAVSIPK